MSIHHRIDNVDLVMWSKYGARDIVIDRIEKVIPPEVINKKILVIDRFEDLKNKTALEYDWEIVLNKGKGISGCANTALDNVESEYFISFEDDILLAENWWNRIPKLLEKDKVAIASGIRLPDKPYCIRKLQEYIHERYRKEFEKDESFIQAKSLDNTIYKTDVLREIGGFPTLSVSAGVDTVLAYKIYDAGYRWLVDYDTVSTHLRGSLWKEIKHYYWYGKCQKGISKVLGKERTPSFARILLITLHSPIRALDVAWKKKCWKIFFVYPIMRVAVLFGVIQCYLRD
jgi:GT2 family glycosyltransferase